MFPLKTIAIGIILLLIGIAGFVYAIGRPRPQIKSLSPDLLGLSSQPPIANDTDGLLSPIDRKQIMPISRGSVPKVWLQQIRSNVTLLNPSMAETFTAPATVKLRASVNPKFGVEVVEFYTSPAGTTLCQSITTQETPTDLVKIGAAYAPAYEFEWERVVPGNYTIVAMVKYQTKLQEISSPVVIVVNSEEDHEGSRWMGWMPMYGSGKHPVLDPALMALPTPTPTLASCPTISVDVMPIYPESNTINFRATFAGYERPSDPTYHWRVSGGEIVSGQGTEMITVLVDKILNRGVTATVGVGRFHVICPSFAFASVAFDQPLWLTDSFRKLLLELSATKKLDVVTGDDSEQYYIALSGGQDNCVEEELLKQAGLLTRYFVDIRGLNRNQISIINGGPIDKEDVLENETPDIEIGVLSPENQTWVHEAQKKGLALCKGRITESGSNVSSIPIYRKCPDVDEPISYSTQLSVDNFAINTCPYNPRDPQNSTSQIKLTSSVEAGNYATFPTFKYWSNAGMIVGRGAEAIWDLSAIRLQPGVYTAIAKADDGCDCSNIHTASIAITNHCTPCLDLVRVCRPQSEERSFQHFHAITGDFAVAGQITFKWTVTKGKIVSGQGSADIFVDTVGLSPGEEFVVTVEVSGLLRYCVNKLSLDAVVGDVPCNITHTKFDEYGGNLSSLRRARRRNSVPREFEGLNGSMEDPTDGLPAQPDEISGQPRTDEKEWIALSWTPHVKIDETVNIKVVYSRTTETFKVSTNLGNVSEELRLGNVLKEWFGSAYETFGYIRLRTAGLRCGSCSEEQYQSFDKPKLEWSWPLKPEGKGIQSFNLELWVKGEPRVKSSGKSAKSPEKVWSKDDLKIEVTEPLVTKTTALAGGGLCAVLGFGLCVRGLKIYWVGDTYNVGQAVAVGRNVTITNATVNQKTIENDTNGGQEQND